METTDPDEPVQKGVLVTASFLEVSASLQHQTNFVGVSLETADVQRTVSGAVDVVDVVLATFVVTGVEYVEHCLQCRRVRHRCGHMQRRLAVAVEYLRVQSLQLANHIGAAFHFTERFTCRCDVNPLKPSSSNYYTLPYRPNLPFLISDIRALWRSALSARVPECQKLKTVG